MTVAVTNGEDCPNHGCPLFPLDVVSSVVARKGLEFLRNQEKEEKKDPMEYAKVMESLKAAGNEDKVALTLTGYKGGSLESQTNQDSATIISPYLVACDQEDDTQLLGVFDGHGEWGGITSDHACKVIPQILAQKLKEQVQMEQVSSPNALKESIVTKVIQEAFIEADLSDPTGGVGGATATMILQLGHRLYVANAGDSRSFIGVYVDGMVDVVYASREDKPDLPDERRRITEAGGYVSIPIDPRNSVPRAHYIDSLGRVGYGVSMSRSIGDWQAQGVIAEPIVDVLNIATLVKQAIADHREACKSQMASMMRCMEEKKDDDNDDCPALDPSAIQILAVSASDGMMDFLKPQEIASEMGVSFFAADGKHPFVVAENLIMRAADGWEKRNYCQYRDDIALSAVKVIINEKILKDGSPDSD